MNKLLENFRYSKKYIAVILIIYPLLFLCFYTFSLINISILNSAFISLLLCALLLYVFGNIRRKELTAIRDVIRSITNKQFSSSDEILLDSNLIEIEEDIKLMFMQSKRDIEYLKRLEQVRTEFLGNVSHELRTPIFSIQGYLETLLEGALYDEKVNRIFLAKANHHVHNLNNLLNDLIDISMIESGEMNLSFRYFSIEELLSEIINDLGPLAEEKSLNLKLISERRDLLVLGDKNKLKQVFVNLIQNAIKYTENGKVEIIVIEEHKTVFLSVKDTGIGISNKDLNRIFERFYRVDKDRSRAAGGTGLGLAIVKHIVEAHESKIEVKSEPGKGSEFFFRIKK
ncbi:MAG: sensor histidine kinase [Bacillota bacterium]